MRAGRTATQRKFSLAKDDLIAQAVHSALAAMRSYDSEETMRYAEAMPSKYEAVTESLAPLLKFQFDVTNTEYQASVSRYENSRLIAFFSLAAAILILVWLGFNMTRSITSALGAELSAINQADARIAAGNLNFTIPLSAKDIG